MPGHAAQGRRRTVQAPARLGLALLWSSYVLAVVLGWRAAAAPDAAFHGAQERWDGQDVHAWEGVYGDYLTAKVAKVFPQLADALR